MRRQTDPSAIWTSADRISRVLIRPRRRAPAVGQRPNPSRSCEKQATKLAEKNDIFALKSSAALPLAKMGIPHRHFEHNLHGGANPSRFLIPNMLFSPIPRHAPYLMLRSLSNAGRFHLL